MEKWIVLIETESDEYQLCWIENTEEEAIEEIEQDIQCCMSDGYTDWLSDEFIEEVLIKVHGWTKEEIEEIQEMYDDGDEGWDLLIEYDLEWCDFYNEKEDELFAQFKIIQITMEDLYCLFSGVSRSKESEVIGSETMGNGTIRHIA